MAESFTYIGYGTRGYSEYVDRETGRMLVAETGQSYQIRAVWPGLPVPPDDGYWAANNSKAARAAKASAKPVDDTGKDETRIADKGTDSTPGADTEATDTKAGE